MKIKMSINIIKLLLAIGVLTVWMGCGSQTPQPEVSAAVQSGQGMEEAASGETAEQEAEPAVYRMELLGLAFESASAMPMKPFIKNRSKAQESVVAGLLELGQADRALEQIERIENWRQGAAYADLAIHLLKKGEPRMVQRYLDKAKVIADTTEDWRRDSIWVKIAHAQVLMGNESLAAEFGTDVVESEKGKLSAVKAASADEAGFDERLAEIDGLIAAGTFDVIKNALEAYAVLFDQFYNDAQKRDTVETTIRSTWTKMPPLNQFEVLIRLAESAAWHGDHGKAQELADDAQQYLDEYSWPLNTRIALTSELAELRHRAGDAPAARTLADSMLALYEEQGETIVNIYRARALHPLAEAYQTMGDTEKALRIYRMAVEAGVANLNSVPRAEDLTATCLSMAMHAVQPDEALWNRLREIKDGLGTPW